MRDLVILGGGTAGTMAANKLRQHLDPRAGRSPSSTRTTSTTTSPATCSSRSVSTTATRSCAAGTTSSLTASTWCSARSTGSRPTPGTVRLTDGRTLRYDYLVIATGTTPRPDQTPGMLGPEWRRSIFDFYTLEGAEALRVALEDFDHGRLVVHITEMPIKCPVAPLEFTFLADAWLSERGLRDRVELVFVTPLDGAFTQPVASARLGAMLEDAQDRRGDRLHGRADRRRAGGWSRTTSARCPSTCS